MADTEKPRLRGCVWPGVQAVGGRGGRVEEVEVRGSENNVKTNPEVCKPTADA